MTNFLIATELPLIHYYFDEKKNQIKQRINSLKLQDVKEDSAFERTIQKLKDDFNLTPVVIGEPSITNNETAEKDVYNNPFLGRKTINIVTIEFPFTGSVDLFGLKPMNFTFSSSSNLHAYQPFGKFIEIEIELDKLDKAIAINEAYKEIKVTRDIIESNNNSVNEWNVSSSSLINSLINAKRTELIEFYK